MSSPKTTQETPVVESPKLTRLPDKRLVIVSWGVTILAVVILVFVLFRVNPFKTKTAQTFVDPVGNAQEIPLPAFQSANPLYSLVRLPNLNTNIPDGLRQFPIKYTVEEGDSIFAIAKKFALKPESILWANYDLLNDDPTYLAVGWKLTIPPTDGIYYKLKQGDTLQKVAEKYKATVTDIVSWPSNQMDVSDPKLGLLEYVMIPGGYRDMQPWIVPLAFAPRSGATRVVSGPGGCQAPSSGPVGSTAFIWPVGNHFLSGFDFSSYHLGIDIAAATGTPVHASDAGTVIYAGWNDSGYGYMVEIDHNNGYSTVYAHFSAVSVACGQSVYQGSVIGSAGSTGKSTGAHVHFEIRLNGGFLNPWSVLP